MTRLKNTNCGRFSQTCGKLTNGNITRKGRPNIRTTRRKSGSKKLSKAFIGILASISSSNHP